ncbi:hypothetical protein ACLOJK_007573 [Asimina triloba]
MISERDYDIEVLTGNEKECIEMNLVLGVADLHTPEAVVGAESAMLGSRLIHPSTICSDSSDSEDSDVDDNEETSCLKGKDHEQNAGGKDTSSGDNPRFDPPGTNPVWCEDATESKMFSSKGIMFPIRGHSTDISTSIRAQGTKGRDNTLSEAILNKRDAEDHSPENENTPKGFGLSYLTGQLDLNAHDENDVASSCKEFDLNGFSWG